MSRSTVVLIVLGVLLALVCVLGLIVYGYVNNLNRTAVEVYEKPLSAQYLDCQNELSNYISTFYEISGGLIVQSDIMDEVISNAITGRYGEDGFAANGAFFSAIVEAYPEASVEQLLENWGRFQDYIVAGREQFKNCQSSLLDMLQSYDGWREGDLLRRAVLDVMGFPSDNLEARIGDAVYYGEQARDRMYRIVLTGAALDAYESGTLDPLQIPTPPTE